jgi:hypothetical protein
VRSQRWTPSGVRWPRTIATSAAVKAGEALRASAP